MTRGVWFVLSGVFLVISGILYFAHRPQQANIQAAVVSSPATVPNPSRPVPTVQGPPEQRPETPPLPSSSPLHSVPEEPLPPGFPIIETWINQDPNSHGLAKFAFIKIKADVQMVHAWSRSQPYDWGEAPASVYSAQTNTYSVLWNQQVATRRWLFSFDPQTGRVTLSQHSHYLDGRPDADETSVFVRSVNVPASNPPADGTPTVTTPLPQLTDANAWAQMVIKGDVDQIRMALQSGVDVNLATTPGKITALHIAAARGYRDVVVLLLQSGAKVDARDSTGTTPLILSAISNRPDVTRILLSSGADCDIKGTGNTPQRTALEVAREMHDRDEVIRALNEGCKNK